MTASRTRPPLALVSVLVVGLLAAAPLLAQQEDVGEPLRLSPSDRPDSEGEPSTPATEDVVPEAPAIDIESPRRDGEPLPGEGVEGIEVDLLDELDPETIGVLDPGRGGLGADIWEGTPRWVVEHFLSRIPDDLHSPVLRDMARRLLLSSTAPPVRERAAGDFGGNLLALRLDRLAAMGDLWGLDDLLRVVPQAHADETVARLRVETHMLKDELDPACAIVRRSIADSDRPFWQMALAVCQLADGHHDQASLTVSLLRESGTLDDAAFQVLFEAAYSGDADVLDDEVLANGIREPMHLALLDVSGLPVDDHVFDNARASVRVAVVEREEKPLALRARLAEEVAAKGALPADKLAALYARFEFASGRLANAASLVDEDAVAAMTPTRRRALFHQAASDEPSGAVRAELVRQVVEDADKILYPAVARVFAPIVADMPAQPDLAWFAQIAGRMLYVAEYEDAAQGWLTMAQQEAIINPEAKAAVTAMVPYARLSGNADLPANGGLAAWRSAHDAIGNEADDAVALRESLLRAAYDALGEDDTRRWVEIAAESAEPARPLPSGALIYALRDAGAQGRVGETVLLTLAVLGESGLAEAHPLALGTALHALAQAGLEREARRLAIEAAVVNGI